jgi:hypothetical protein
VGPLLDGVNQLLEAAGIRITAAGLAQGDSGAQGTVRATGVEIELRFDGSDGGPLAQLLALVPTDGLPGSGIPGVPVNTSPQALVNLLKETHVTSVALGSVSASVDASEPVVLGEPASGSSILDAGGSGGAVGGGGTPPAFTTPLPDLAGARTVTGGGRIPGRAVGLLVVVLAVLSLPVWGRASAKLMDAALADPAACAAPPPGGSRRDLDGRT